MKLRLLVIWAFLLNTICLWAYDTEIDGLFYNRLTENTVALASVDTLYSGHLEIPEEILFDGNRMKVTSISRRALENCKRLTSVDLPKSIIEIEYRAFYNCTNLQTINLQSGISTIGNAVFENCYELDQLTIPVTVKSIGSDLFRECKSLRSISIPNQITTLPERIFLRCEMLNEIKLPQSIQHINSSAFSGCKSLQEIILPDNLLSIGLYAFHGAGIKTLVVPNSVTSIGSYSFQDCESLSSIKLSESITKISNYFFSGCSNLSFISLPKTITAIGEHAFYGCSSLNSIDITENVESIGKYAFAHCPNLSSVVLPNSLKSIGDFCFYQSSKINIRSYIINPFKVDFTVFMNVDKDAVLYVPRNTKETYLSVGGWGKFNIVEMEDYPNSFSLKITASGSGSASYGGTTVRSKTSTFTVNEGSNATIMFSPDSGNRIKSVKVNSGDVTSSVSNNSYTVSNIAKDTSVEVEFEAIPLTTYTLSIKVSGNGSASHSSSTIRGKTSSFTVNEGSNATITFSPDNGYRVKSVMVNGMDVTSSVTNNSYTISNINSDTSVEVEFDEELKTFVSNGINYSVSSYDDKTVIVGGGNYGRVLDVPATIIYQDINWNVVGIDNAALAGNADLSAIIWNPAANFTINVSNPNLLLYVSSASYAPASITNVIVNGIASKIVLSDAASGNDFYCPQVFTAQSISYTHNYVMSTGIGEPRGWETIALPFDVQKITHSSKGEIIPFAKWKSGDSKKPFWLMTYGTGGWADASRIKANTPYIISMPNHQDYKPEFRLSGSVTFYAENVTVPKSDDYQSGSYNGNTFVPNYSNVDNNGYYALNVNNDYVTYDGGSAEGSRFVVNLRPVHPFEAYMISSSNAARSIAILDGMTTGIENVIALIDENKGTRVYNMKGQLVIAEMNQSLEDVKKRLPAGVYIVNGKKLIIK